MERLRYTTACLYEAGLNIDIRLEGIHYSSCYPNPHRHAGGGGSGGWQEAGKRDSFPPSLVPATRRCQLPAPFTQLYGIGNKLCKDDFALVSQFLSDIEPVGVLNSDIRQNDRELNSVFQLGYQIFIKKNQKYADIRNKSKDDFISHLRPRLQHGSRAGAARGPDSALSRWRS